MNPSLNHQYFSDFAAVSDNERDVLLASARSLKQAAKAGHSKPLLLRGKNIGLLCEAPDSRDAQHFERAARQLGAHVARIHPSVSGLTTSGNVVHIARMLGRLYDAIECQGLRSDLVQQLRREAGVPVYEGIGCADHPTASWAALVDDTPDSDSRQCVMQALLASTIGSL